jgi:hypothetical protein
MAKVEYQIGERVTLSSGDWLGHSGVVSWPLTVETPGYVLVHSNGRIAGVQVSATEVQPATPASTGFTQLTYLLIQLSSHLIERTFV